MRSCVLEYLKLVEVWHFLDLSPCKMCLKPPPKVGHGGGGVAGGCHIYIYVHVYMYI